MDFNNIFKPDEALPEAVGRFYQAVQHRKN